MSAGPASASSPPSLGPNKMIINPKSTYYQHVNEANMEERSSHHPKYMQSNEKYSPRDHEHADTFDTLIIRDPVTKGINAKVFAESSKRIHFMKKI